MNQKDGTAYAFRYDHLHVRNLATHMATMILTAHSENQSGISQATSG